MWNFSANFSPELPIHELELCHRARKKHHFQFDEFDDGIFYAHHKEILRRMIDYVAPKKALHSGGIVLTKPKWN
jgi:hypothetical protein